MFLFQFNMREKEVYPLLFKTKKNIRKIKNSKVITFDSEGKFL